MLLFSREIMEHACHKNAKGTSKELSTKNKKIDANADQRLSTKNLLNRSNVVNKKN